MATGLMWDTTDPKFIVADWDQDDITDIPVGFAGIAADRQSSVVGPSVIADPNLNVSILNSADNVVKIRVKRADEAIDLIIGRPYAFTVRAPFADGSRVDQAFWLRVKPY